jgi:hypothetical protein
MALVLVLSCALVWIMAVPETKKARFMVPAANTGQTLVAFIYKTPPPWPRGNCFDVSSKRRWVGPLEGFCRWLWRDSGFQTMSWKVCNMHAGNFNAIVRRLKLQEVQIQPVGGPYCIITDPRIPREYLLKEPCRTCFQVPRREELLRQYSEHFSK